MVVTVAARRPRPAAHHRGPEGPPGGWAIANAAYEQQRHNPSVTEMVTLPDRGHSLTIDSGWREVAQTALDLVERFAGATAGDQARG
jgi:hypothetical protein